MFCQEFYKQEAIDKLVKCDPYELMNMMDWRDGKTNAKFKKQKDKIEECMKILRFLNNAKKNNYKANIQYNPSADNREGRLYSSQKSMQNVCYSVRDFIRAEDLIDYDMKNAHPTLAIHLFKKLFGETVMISTLKDYENNRAVILENHGITKMEVLATMNQDRCLIQKPFLKTLHKELKPLKQKIFNNPDYTYLRGTNTRNPHSSVLNKLLCIEERKIIDKIFKTYGFQVNMFDGFMTNKSIPLEELNELTKEQGIKWDIKCPAPLEYIEPDEKEDESMLVNYNQLKEEFEKNNFKLRNPTVFVEVGSDGKLIMRKIADFKVVYNCLFYYLVGVDKKGKKKIEKKKFINAWLEDEFARSYDNVDFYPPPLACPDKVYNLYSGFAYEKEDWENNYDKGDYTLIMNHLRLLAGDDKTDECVEFILNYLADIIQYPGIMPRVSLVFQSDEGAGKNMFFDNFFNLVVGRKYYLPSENAEDFVGSWCRLDNKICAVWNETEGADTFRKMAKIKALITDDHVRINQKNIQPYYLQSHLRLLFFSNRLTPVPITAGDRRFQVFNCGKPVGGDYYSKLYAAMTDKNILNGFVDMLKKRDVRNIDFRRTRVLTHYYQVLKSGNNALIDTYVKDLFYDKSLLANAEEIERLEKETGIKQNIKRKSTFYKDYKDWCEKRGVKEQGKQKWAMYFTKNYGEGFISKQFKGQIHWVFNAEKILDKLVEIKEIDEETRQEIELGVDEDVELEITMADYNLDLE